MNGYSRSTPAYPQRLRVLTALSVLFMPAALLAQERRSAPTESFLNQQRSIDQQLRDRRRAAAPADAMLDWEWGGWVDYYIFHFDDGIQSSRVYQRPGTAFWTRLSIDDGAHQFFARVRLNYSYFNPGDEFDRQQDWVGPNFDRAWYEVDFARAFHLDSDGRYNVKARVGRQEVIVGTGYAINLPMDAVTVEAKLGDFRVTSLVARTIGSTPNIDLSSAVDSHSNRMFYGVQATYDGWQKHQPFAYAVWQQDHTDERPQNYFQEYDYDSAYFGLGSRGSILHNLNYWGEVVWECGKSFGDGMIWRRDDVNAWGWDAGIEYLWDSALRPRVAFEYMFASGDSDRLTNATGSQGGNRRGGDRAFNGFGYRDTGISLAPALTNLHIWKLGGSLTPLSHVEALRDFEVGSNWFLYHKHQSSGAISDTTADMFQGFVGWEMDYFVNWRFASDLSWTARYGVFFPGDAFSDRDTRQFIMTGITWSY